MLPPPRPDTADRKRWMGVLARATGNDVRRLVDLLSPVPDYTVIRRAETGTVMVEGRAGGAGSRFNLGEATVTRCVIQTSDGQMGFSYALGRDKQKSEQAAVIDMVMQGDDAIRQVVSLAIDALEAAEQAVRNEQARKAAATKVNFFTLVRGDE